MVLPRTRATRRAIASIFTGSLLFGSLAVLRLLAVPSVDRDPTIRQSQARNAPRTVRS